MTQRLFSVSFPSFEGVLKHLDMLTQYIKLKKIQLQRVFLRQKLIQKNQFGTVSLLNTPPNESLGTKFYDDKFPTQLILNIMTC